MEKVKIVEFEKALYAACSGDFKAYALYELHSDTTLDDIYAAVAYCVEAEEEPVAEVKTPSGKLIDHGRIVALYTANPPRSVKWIAQDMQISQQTVINHLKKEGIYDSKK